MKILVADKRPVVRAGLRAFLRSTEFEIAAEVETVAEINSAVRRFSPRRILLDATKTAFDEAKIPERCALVFFHTTWSKGKLLQEIRTPPQRKRVKKKNRLLTPRELDVLRCITQGLSNKEIAKTLEIGFDTVKEHVGNLLRKTSLADRTQLALWAVRRKVLENS